jgi:hypothetical protein
MPREMHQHVLVTEELVADGGLGKITLDPFYPRQHVGYHWRKAAHQSTQPDSRLPGGVIEERLADAPRGSSHADSHPFSFGTVKPVVKRPSMGGWS